MRCREFDIETLALLALVTLHVTRLETFVECREQNIVGIKAVVIIGYHRIERKAVYPHRVDILLAHGIRLYDSV